MAPMDAVAIPLPSEEHTPPVMMMNRGVGRVVFIGTAEGKGTKEGTLSRIFYEPAVYSTQEWGVRKNLVGGV